MWTKFWDMHSGGGTKLWRHADGTIDDNGSWRRAKTDEQPVEFIYIEAPQEEARVIFYNRFGRNPDRVTCTCCGSDYSLDSEEDFAQLTGYHRNARCDESSGAYVEELDDRFGRKSLISVAAYKRQPEIHIISASKIKKAERVGHVPAEGYVWAGE